MIQIEQKDLQPNIEYFLECFPNYNRTDPSKLRCVFVNHMINDGNTFSQYYFRDVKPINPEKYPDYICNNMSIRTYNSTLPCTNHFKFYQISKQIFYQKSVDRLYEKAIDLKLRDIIGDPHFRFI